LFSPLCHSRTPRTPRPYAPRLHSLIPRNQSKAQGPEQEQEQLQRQSTKATEAPGSRRRGVTVLPRIRIPDTDRIPTIGRAQLHQTRHTTNDNDDDDDQPFPELSNAWTSIVRSAVTVPPTTTPLFACLVAFRCIYTRTHIYPSASPPTTYPSVTHPRSDPSQFTPTPTPTSTSNPISTAVLASAPPHNRKLNPSVPGPASSPHHPADFLLFSLPIFPPSRLPVSPSSSSLRDETVRRVVPCILSSSLLSARNASRADLLPRIHSDSSLVEKSPFYSRTCGHAARRLVPRLTTSVRALWFSGLGR
jgi:hypothetical protein